MAGNNKTLELFEDFNGKFINQDEVYNQIYFATGGKDMTLLELDRCYFHDMESVGIECMTGSPNDITKKINYYDNEEKCYKAIDFALKGNVFDQKPLSIINRGKLKGIKDVLSFPIHVSDTFLAKILISVCMYKKK